MALPILQDQPAQIAQELSDLPIVGENFKVQVEGSYKQELEHQQYRIVGSHSAVKVCGWTKNMLRGEGGCYKLKFYGIQSHQCMQMTVNLSCANRCTFCWRGTKAPVEKEWNWKMDSPSFIIDEALKAHYTLLQGFGGHAGVPKAMFDASQHVGHVALSLTGEPIVYPKINELCENFHRKRISTFIVTNAQYPEAIKNLHTITQLYLSLDAPNKEVLKQLDIPLFPDYWERYQQSLDECAKKKYRTTARLTVVKGINDIEPQHYAQLIRKGDFDFIEIKGYMHVGESQKRLPRSAMPDFAYVKEFGMKVLAFLEKDYEFASEHLPSDVILIAKKQYHKKTWIDFNRFFELMNVEHPPANLDAMEYSKAREEVKESEKDFGVVQ
ncbi:MAG: 4-demethylwyosine synthase TYW1 [Candidatus Iainarchaeum archaeon]|uniref:4-demethylwyosine synthase TYW1 n=1 Tax=Candidatus Iainarchaeum sp. TaxID=3101447 RepID=A0A7T9DK45_9ARCH|nr:MAG: 4-demethylwyosine synthase TYW1 [Candidatus Diapherotrites archaeon]